jgi:hypothetical protein
MVAEVEAALAEADGAAAGGQSMPVSAHAPGRAEESPGREEEVFQAVPSPASVGVVVQKRACPTVLETGRIGCRPSMVEEVVVVVELRPLGALPSHSPGP